MLRKSLVYLSTLLVLWIGVLVGAWPSMAQSISYTPGEDPIVLTGPVKYISLPGGAPPKSSQLDRNPEMPAWMKARMARYEAKAFSATADDGTILTDNDVVTTATVQGLRKTCVQEIGNNSGTSNSNSLGNTPQVVVLRGDLINICR
jgi:hypothetical protein